MKIAIIAPGETALPIAGLLKSNLTDGTIFTTVSGREDTEHIASLSDFVPRAFKEYDGIVFVGALGICVRTIANSVCDKHEDPAVVCVDSLGHFAIPVISGHVGGANRLASAIAGMIGAVPVVTTHSDLAGLWPLDTLGERFGWSTVHKGEMNAIIAHFVNLRPTALLLDVRDRGTDFLETSLPSHVHLYYSLSEIPCDEYGLIIAVTPRRLDLRSELSLTYIPKCMVAGIGLAHHPANPELVAENILTAVDNAGIYRESIGLAASIDLKRDEEVLDILPFRLDFFTSEELAEVNVPNPSDKVASHVGTPSVAEASALLASGAYSLEVEKIKGENFTVALAMDQRYSRRGHIEIVGAGPGDPDLVSVRGRHFLETADLILYAGSLVPKALTDCAKPNATVISSADLDLQQQFELMKEFYDRGALVVRLHTGDPCIFGAIEEQMRYFDEYGMSYHITPGISSFQAAAAELCSQFTIPERVQTIILTRGEGRTPMPDKEKLHLLARSQSTMCIFLSASIVDKVQEELLMEYPPETPVAACYHLTWPDQRIYRGRLDQLADIVHDNNLTLTTMIVVGEAIDNRQGTSRLYDAGFTHLFRTATKDTLSGQDSIPTRE